MDLSNPNDWIGRTVILKGGEGDDSLYGGLGGKTGVVLAVDDTPWQPSCWVRVVWEPGAYPQYRSLNLTWVTDVETGEEGPNWGTAGFDTKDKLAGAMFTDAKEPTT